jgi:ArsR family metal-binding transcriptional regulator
MEQKLYIEYRLYFNPTANQEYLKDMAEDFQAHINDEWNHDCPHPELEVNDVTYEIVMEISCKTKCRRCGSETGPAFQMCADCIKELDSEHDE